METDIEVDYLLVEATPPELFDFDDTQAWLLVELAENSEQQVI